MNSQRPINKKLISSCAHFFGTMISFIPFVLFYKINRTLLKRYSERAFHYKNHSLRHLNQVECSLHVLASPPEPRKHNHPNSIYLFQEDKSWRYTIINREQKEIDGNLNAVYKSSSTLEPLTAQNINKSKAIQKQIINVISKAHNPDLTLDLSLEVYPFNIFIFYYAAGAFIGANLGYVTLLMLVPLIKLHNMIFGRNKTDSILSSCLAFFSKCNNKFKSTCNFLLPKLLNNYVVSFVYGTLYSSYILLAQMILNIGSTVFLSSGGLLKNVNSRLRNPEKVDGYVDEIIKEHFFPGRFSKNKIDAALQKKIDKIGEKAYYSDYNIISSSKPNDQKKSFKDKLSELGHSLGQGYGTGVNDGLNNNSAFLKGATKSKQPVWAKENQSNAEKTTVKSNKYSLVPFYAKKPNRENLPKIDKKEIQREIVAQTIKLLPHPSENFVFKPTRLLKKALRNYYIRYNIAESTILNTNIDAAETLLKIKTNNSETNKQIAQLLNQYLNRIKSLEQDKEKLIQDTNSSLYERLSESPVSNQTPLVIGQSDRINDLQKILVEFHKRIESDIKLVIERTALDVNNYLAGNSQAKSRKEVINKLQATYKEHSLIIDKAITETGLNITSKLSTESSSISGKFTYAKLQEYLNAIKVESEREQSRILKLDKKIRQITKQATEKTKERPAQHQNNIKKLDNATIEHYHEQLNKYFNAIKKLISQTDPNGITKYLKMAISVITRKKDNTQERKMDELETLLHNLTWRKIQIEKDTYKSFSEKITEYYKNYYTRTPTKLKLPSLNDQDFNAFTNKASDSSDTIEKIKKFRADADKANAKHQEIRKLEVKSIFDFIQELPLEVNPQKDKIKAAKIEVEKQILKIPGKLLAGITQEQMIKQLSKKFTSRLVKSSGNKTKAIEPNQQLPSILENFRLRIITEYKKQLSFLQDIREKAVKVKV